jgi:hypothetical protein
MSEGSGDVMLVGSDDHNTQTRIFRVLCACFGARPENSMVVLVHANAAGTPNVTTKIGKPT